jgi:hypothetical protein
MPLIASVAHNGYNIDITQPHFGIEIEVENVRIPDNLSDTNWQTAADGSLRNAGVEFLSNGPWLKGTVEREVPKFYQWMDRYEYTTGMRTSTHVHASVLGKTNVQVAAICTLYVLMEPLLYRYCGPLREENIYCVPWYRGTDELEYVQHLMQGHWRHINESCKYSGLYLEPICRFGTLEFRQAPVFPTAELLLTWVDVIERIVESGFDTPEHVLDTFRELTVDEFVEGIFGERLTRILRGYCESDFEELLDEYDVETNAELCCTYNENPQITGWFAPQWAVQGNGTDGYHRSSVTRHSFIEAPDYFDELDEYPEEEEDY